MRNNAVPAVNAPRGPRKASNPAPPRRRELSVTSGSRRLGSRYRVHGQHLITETIAPCPCPEFNTPENNRPDAAGSTVNVRRHCLPIIIEYADDTGKIRSSFDFVKFHSSDHTKEWMSESLYREICISR